MRNLNLCVMALRAQDACNLLYVMWRIEPESKLVVSVKTNPGQHTSASVAIVDTRTSNRDAAHQFLY